jgi:7-cyano-7-deazaguanine synthase
MKRLILLSGGLDSATLLVSYKQSKNTYAIFFDYGQRALTHELQKAEMLTAKYDVPLIKRNIVDVFTSSGCTILATSDRFTEQGTTELEFRNGVLLSCAISVAKQLFPTEDVEILLGVTKQYVSYSDCSPEFIELYNKLAQLCSNNKISIRAPFLYKEKKEVFELTKKLSLDPKDTWSCYNNNETPCLACAACADRISLGLFE